MSASRSRRMSSSSATKKAAPASRPRPCMSPSRCCRPASASPPSISIPGRKASPITSRTAATGPSAPASSSKCPVHYCVARGFGCELDEIEAQEFAAFAEAVSAVENSHDFVVIDTPGTDSYLMRLAHSMADTLITPLNDSFVDFDVLGTVDPTTFEVVGRQPLCRDGARGAPPAPPGRRRADRLGRACATGCRRSDRATSGWSARASRSSPSSSASAPSTALPNGWSIASSSRAGSPRSTTSTKTRSACARPSRT